MPIDVNNGEPKPLAFDDPSYIYLLSLLYRADMLRFPVDQALHAVREWHAMCLDGSCSPALAGRPSATGLRAGLQMITRRDERWALLRRWSLAKYWSRSYRGRIADEIDALARLPDTIDSVLGDLLDRRAA